MRAARDRAPGGQARHRSSPGAGCHSAKATRSPQPATVLAARPGRRRTTGWRNWPAPGSGLPSVLLRRAMTYRLAAPSAWGQGDGAADMLDVLRVLLVDA